MAVALAAIAIPALSALRAQNADAVAVANPGAEAKRELKIFEPGQKWMFVPGTEFPPGGKGSFVLKRTGDDKAAGQLSFDFTAGGNYVGATTLFEIPEGFSELRFRVKAGKAAFIGIRLMDKTKQTHQTPLSYSDAGEWQLLRINLTRRAPLRFGGAKDGVLHYPLRSITLFVQKKGQDAPGEIQFCDFMLYR